jgi:ribonucleoside-diphosphate reductase beta chain
MEHSLDVVRTEFDLFSEALLQRMVKKYKYDEIFPYNNVKNDSTVTFQVRGTPNEWLDLDDTYLQVKYKLLNHDGSAIENEQATNIQTIEEPNILHNLWSQTEMFINNKPVKSVVTPYPMRAYMENLLTTCKDGLPEKYQTEGFWKERAGANFDHAVEDTVAHLTERSPWRTEVQLKHRGSREHVLYGKLAMDLWRQGRNIPPNHDMKLVLTGNRPQFYLRSSMAAGQEHKLQLEEVKLIVKRVQLYDDTQAQVDKAIDEAGAIKFPIKRVQLISPNIARGTKVFQENIMNGQLPSRVIIGLVDGDAFAGAYNKSPFNFKHYDVEEMYLHWNGETFPSNKYTTSFANKDALVPWLNMKRLVTPGQPFFHHTVSYKDFCDGGYTFWVFDMTQDNKCGVPADYNNVKLSGEIRLFIRFGGDAGLTQAVNAVIYAESENQIEIEKDRTLTFDY